MFEIQGIPNNNSINDHSIDYYVRKHWLKENGFKQLYPNRYSVEKKIKKGRKIEGNKNMLKEDP